MRIYLIQMFQSTLYVCIFSCTYVVCFSRRSDALLQDENGSKVPGGSDLASFIHIGSGHTAKKPSLDKGSEPTIPKGIPEGLYTTRGPDSKEEEFPRRNSICNPLSGTTEHPDGRSEWSPSCQAREENDARGGFNDRYDALLQISSLSAIRKQLKHGGTQKRKDDNSSNIEDQNVEQFLSNLADPGVLRSIQVELLRMKKLNKIATRDVFDNGLGFGKYLGLTYRNRKKTTALFGMALSSMGALLALDKYVLGSLGFTVAVRRHIQPYVRSLAPLWVPDLFNTEELRKAANSIPTESASQSASSVKKITDSSSLERIQELVDSIDADNRKVVQKASQNGGKAEVSSSLKKRRFSELNRHLSERLLLGYQMADYIQEHEAENWAVDGAEAELSAFPDASLGDLYSSWLGVDTMLRNLVGESNSRPTIVPGKGDYVRPVSGNTSKLRRGLLIERIHKTKGGKDNSTVVVDWRDSDGHTQSSTVKMSEVAFSARYIAKKTLPILIHDVRDLSLASSTSSTQWGLGMVQQTHLAVHAGDPFNVVDVLCGKTEANDTQCHWRLADGRGWIVAEEAGEAGLVGPTVVSSDEGQILNTKAGTVGSDAFKALRSLDDSTKRRWWAYVALSALSIIGGATAHLTTLSANAHILVRFAVNAGNLGLEFLKFLPFIVAADSLFSSTLAAQKVLEVDIRLTMAVHAVAMWEFDLFRARGKAKDLSACDITAANDSYKDDYNPCKSNYFCMRGGAFFRQGQYSPEGICVEGGLGNSDGAACLTHHECASGYCHDGRFLLNTCQLDELKTMKASSFKQFRKKWYNYLNQKGNFSKRKKALMLALGQSVDMEMRHKSQLLRAKSHRAASNYSSQLSAELKAFKKKAPLANAMLGTCARACPKSNIGYGVRNPITNGPLKGKEVLRIGDPRRCDKISSYHQFGVRGLKGAAAWEASMRGDGFDKELAEHF